MVEETGAEASGEHKLRRRWRSISRLLKKQPILVGELPGGWVLAYRDGGGWTECAGSCGTDELWQADEIVSCSRHGE
jgi:hypothetical protein